jgi:hypothetical protein
MLVNCPSCRRTIEAAALPAGAAASCPFCRAVFQVPAEGGPAAPTVVLPRAAAAQPQPDDESETEPGGWAGTLGWSLVFMVLFALIGAGSGYLVFRWAQSRQTRAAPVTTGTSKSETAADAQLTWRKIGHWSGVGAQRTPPLRTTSPRWRVQWSATPLAPDNPDNFAIHVCDLRGRQLQTPVSIVGAGSDTAYVSTAPGRYALEVFTFDTRWEITVEEPQ